ncbi:MAG: potassium transporter Kup [Nitrospira sp.]|nr:potassium transporter Kup [Nitrospira sp.]MDH4303857.1 potassium transporter Kup [Nitrospira sp.]MDH5194980.1 potassium transporter Kup [Nitrospira sp.]
MSNQPERSTTAGLALAALGVVYGDIGTSPLYALRECFHASHDLPVTLPVITGLLSLIIWALLLVVTVKYLLFVLRADNQGEGGILALMALGQRHREESAFPLHIGPVIALGLFGASLVYGDGIITPAISVLSAVEGIAVETTAYQSYTLPIAITVLLTFFAIQSHGTGRLGGWFGPIMLLWFITLAVLGIRSAVQTPEVFTAFSPHHAAQFLLAHPTQGFAVLGSVFLVLTGAEALYADMGHFGKGPIRLGWYSVVLPSLVLQYLGQGALLVRQPDAVTNPFYLLAPGWFLLPLVVLATLATVIASQAMLSGAFSLTQQAIQLGYLPRMAIRYTSASQIGQIYVPAMNVMMLIGTIGLVLFFQTSSHLAAAYGIAVAGTMVISTLLVFVVARRQWKWSWPLAGLVTGLFLTLDLSFFGANALKIPHGGWLPLVLGAGLFLLMATWNGGRRLVAKHLWSKMPQLTTYLKEVLAQPLPRISGTAVYLTQFPDLTPPSFVQNVRHNKVLHEQLVFLTTTTARVPIVTGSHHVRIDPLAPGVRRVVVQYGFMETPDITRLLAACRAQGLEVDLAGATFFLSRVNSIATPKPGMALWRERLFVFLSRNSQRASSFFHIPAEQVVEIGVVVEI